MSDAQEGSGRASFVQQGIWLNEQRTELGDAYHLSFTLTFDGELDTASILTACSAVLGRHDVLAQAFADGDGLAQVRPAGHAPRVDQADLSDLPPEQRDAELEDRLTTSGQQEFDLRGGPLIRLTLYTLGPARHVLLLVAHHLIFDGLSMELFRRDLLAAYELAVAGRDPVLSALRHPAAAYAAAEESQVADVLPAARQFWRERWQEPAPMLLPGVTGPVRDVDSGAQVEFTVDGRLRTELRAVCADLELTEFDFLLASLHCLLYRYGNDLPVVTIALGLRPEEYAENIGSFAQELPFALPVEAGTTFRDLAQTLHAQLRELYRYRMVPLNRAMTGVRPSALHTTVALSYLPVERTTELAGFKAGTSRRPNASVRGALWTLVHADDSALRFIVRYPSRVLTADGARRIAGHWRQVIEQVTADPETNVDTLPLLTAAERKLLLESRQETTIVRRPGTVLDVIWEQAAQWPDRVAARSETAELTYGELLAAADGLARRIACLHLARGSVIAIRGGGSIATLTGLLAVLKSGNAYLIVDRPDDRGTAVLGRSVAAVLAEPPGADVHGNLVTIQLDSRDCACGTCGSAPVAGPRPEEKACAAYSPGPDGTLELSGYDHRALTDALCAWAGILSVKPGDRWLSLCSPSSAEGPLGFLLPLLSGAQVVFAGPQDAQDDRRLLALIARHDVTHLQATPSRWQRLVDAGLDSPGLTALSGGEALQLPLARRLRGQVGRLWNGYGASGALAWSLGAEVGPDADRITIGRPVGNTRAYVLDDFGALAPAGPAGRLCLAGPGLALGFSGATAATATRFLPDPFGPPGTRLLRTGDRARYRPDGQLVLLGPADRRVRLHGQYVELADIEARLGAHPGLPDLTSRVVVSGEEDDGPALVAYLLSSAAARPPDAELDTWLADILPGTVRVQYVGVAEFPLTDDDKLDLARLRAQPGRDDTAGTDQDLASDKEVAEVSQIWREVLKVSDIGVQDNLFDFGVDSLAVNKISSKIFRKMGVDIPLEVFYESPTITEISNIIARNRRED